MNRVDWPSYLADFHDQRAGITEDVLQHAVDDRGRTAYHWAAEPVGDGLVLDVACGSAPMALSLPGRTYVGVDLSPAELTMARRRGCLVARADATALPLPDDSIDNVVVSLALMLVPLQETLNEIARVLRPGGLLVATLPASRPLPAVDWLRYARLCLALRHPGLSYPDDGLLRQPGAAFAAAGLNLTEDQSRRFICDVRDPGVADDLLASLYLPDVRPERMAAGHRVVRRWVDSTVTTPIRRLVARA